MVILPAAMTILSIYQKTRGHLTKIPEREYPFKRYDFKVNNKCTKHKVKFYRFSHLVHPHCPGKCASKYFLKVFTFILQAKQKITANLLVCAFKKLLDLRRDTFLGNLLLSNQQYPIHMIFVTLVSLVTRARIRQMRAHARVRP
jgi:hypothetical protein